MRLTSAELTELILTMLVVSVIGLFAGGIAVLATGTHGPAPKTWCEIAKALFANCSTPICPISLDPPVIEPACPSGRLGEPTCPVTSCGTVEQARDAQVKDFIEGHDHDLKPLAWGVLLGMALGALVGLRRIINARQQAARAIVRTDEASRLLPPGSGAQTPFSTISGASAPSLEGASVSNSPSSVRSAFG